MYSPKLTGLLLQIGGYIDSAFKEMVTYFNFREVKTYKIKRDGSVTEKKPKAVKDIIDACCIFESTYNLSSNNGGVLIAKLDFGDQELRPFEELAGFIDSPKWWKAYNKVKHEYSLHYKKANLDSVLNGLAGAFLLNVIHYPGIKLLWKLGHLTTGFQAGKGFGELFLNEKQFDGYMERAIPEFESLNIGIRIETPLFLYVHT